MRAYVRPVPSTLSQSMHRMAAAIERHAPAGVVFTRRPEDADLQAVHVIGADSLQTLRAPRCVILQHCYLSAGAPREFWAQAFAGAELVWSHYDLSSIAPRFLRAPLGVDPGVFRWEDRSWYERTLGIVTSGFVSGAPAEAIEDAALACARIGLPTAHLGPQDVVGMKSRPSGWRAHHGISDEDLCRLYGRARWVSGLRYVEGFELPVIEGFACGARPIVFDRPDMRHWYNDFASFVPECSGEELVSHLCAVMGRARPVTQTERDAVLARFDWGTLAREFWGRLL